MAMNYGKRRGFRVNVPVTKAEHDRIFEAAQSDGRTMADFMRRAAEAAARELLREAARAKDGKPE